MTVKSSISLTDQQADFARALVKAGRYPSVSAVLQQGLDLLQQKTEADEVELIALKAVIADRRSGIFLSDEKMDDKLKGLLQQKRREHGLDG